MRVRILTAWHRVRDYLGWAVAPEQGYTATIRQQADQTITLSLPDDRSVNVGANTWGF